MRHSAPEAGRPAVSVPLFILAAGMIMALGPVAIDIYLPAFPALQAEFHAAQSTIQLSLSAYLIGLGVGQVFWGALSDRFGRTRPIMASLLLFALGSMGCVFARSAETLIAWRFVQALGGSAGPVIVRAMVRDLYEKDEAAKMFSLVMLVMMATPIIAPTFGGQILLHEGWRWIFALQVGYAAVAFAVTWAMPETLPSESRLTGTPMDVFAAFRMLAGNRRFVGFALCSAFMSGAIISFLGGSPFLYIVIYHVPTQYYGMLFAINAFGMASLSLFNSRFVMRFGAEKILRVACIWAGVCACVLLAVGIYGVGGLPAIVGALFCVLTTAQLIGTNAMAAALSDVPQMAGTASAAIGIAGSVLGGLAGWATGFFADGSALPILLCVALFSWAALLCNLSLTATAKPSI